MKIINILLLSFLMIPATFASNDEKNASLSPEVAELIVSGKFKEAIKKTTNSDLKASLSRLFNMNKLVAKSYKADIGKEISIKIRGKDENGILKKVKSSTLYVEVDKGVVKATWPVKVKTLPLDFRMQRISLSSKMKNLYFAVKAFKQKNYPAAQFYFRKCGDLSNPLSDAADKKSKYVLSLSVAAVTGNLDRVKELLNKGADLNGVLIAHVKSPKTKAIEKIQSTILIEAIKKQQDAVARYLIKNRANINKANSKGVTPLMFAIMYFPQKIEFIEFMLNHQANVNLIDKAGNNVLTGALAVGRPDAVKLLLKHKVDVNKANKQGFTPIMIAVASNNFEMFEILLNAGADLMKKHPQGWSVFNLDRSKMHPAIKAKLDKVKPAKAKRPTMPGFSSGGVNIMNRR
jgi:ankyrin repeat protein